MDVTYHIAGVDPRNKLCFRNPKGVTLPKLLLTFNP